MDDETILGASERLRRRSIAAGLEIPITRNDSKKVNRLRLPSRGVAKMFGSLGSAPARTLAGVCEKKLSVLGINRITSRSDNVVERCPEMVICFIDIDNFTSYTRDLDPLELVKMLNNYMQTVDRLLQIFKIRKIKTIGDGYMLCTQSEKNESISTAVTRMCDMFLFLRDLLREDASYLGGHRLTVRAGVHVGEVVAGLIGIDRVQFDIFGPAVNLTSRLESTAPAATLQVSEKVVSLCRNVYTFEKTSSFLKGFGNRTTYTVIGSARHKR